MKIFQKKKTAEYSFSKTYCEDFYIIYLAKRLKGQLFI